MLASATTRNKLAHAVADLLHEFPDHSEQHVEELIGSVASDLLEAARFDDFVPVLAHRRAREHLRVGGAVTVPSPGRAGVAR